MLTGGSTLSDINRFRDDYWVPRDSGEQVTFWRRNAVALSDVRWGRTCNSSRSPCCRGCEGLPSSSIQSVKRKKERTSPTTTRGAIACTGRLALYGSAGRLPAHQLRQPGRGNDQATFGRCGSTVATMTRCRSRGEGSFFIVAKKHANDGPCMRSRQAHGTHQANELREERAPAHEAEDHHVAGRRADQRQARDSVDGIFALQLE